MIETTLAVLLAIGLAVGLLGFGLCLLNLRSFAPPRELGGGDALPLVSVCVPARNEAANIESCVRSLLAQRGVRLEVLVYDDQSADATPEIVARLAGEDPRVVRVPTQPLPEGWNGKQWGCERMGRASGGPWLLFTDADVRFEPDCVRLALGDALGRGLGLTSTFPRQETGTLGEALIVPLIHFILLSYLPFGRMRGTLDPAASAGCGQFLLVRRDAWIAAGGHGAFRSSMHDGIRLPRAVRAAGFPTDLFDGTALLRCRMYHGFRATWRGFAKNAYEGLGSTALLVAITIMHMLAHLLPWCVLGWAAASLFGAVPGPGRGTLLLAAAAALLGPAQRLVLARRFGQSRTSALLHPVGILLMTLIQWHSALLHWTGRRAWKGRIGEPAPRPR